MSGSHQVSSLERESVPQPSFPGPHVDCVTLSDSVPSFPPCPALKAAKDPVAQGAPNVVCLDSDTDSDASVALPIIPALHGPTTRQELPLSTIVVKNERSGPLLLEAVSSASHLNNIDKNNAVKKCGTLQSCSTKKELSSPSSTAKSPLEKKSLLTGCIEPEGCIRAVCDTHSTFNESSSLVSSDSDDRFWNTYQVAWGDSLRGNDNPENLIKGSQISSEYDHGNGHGVEETNYSSKHERQSTDAACQIESDSSFSRTLHKVGHSRSSDSSGKNSNKSKSSGDRFGELSDSGDSKSFTKRKLHDEEVSRPRKMGGDRRVSSVQALGKAEKLAAKEAAKQKRLEERIRKRQEEDARKKQKQEEKEKLKREKEEERVRQRDDRKRRNEEERRRREELKAEAAERRKVEREKEMWQKGKFALQNITVLIDTKVVEGGLIGGHLLGRLAEKGLKYNLVSNPIRKTVVWQMKLPSKDLNLDLQDSQSMEDSVNRLGSQLLLENVELAYVLVVLEAQDFSEMVAEGSLDKHILGVQKQYPGFTVCYLINKLMWYLHKRDQQRYKNPEDSWTRPPVEQVLAQLVTHFSGVHSRLCLDEAEVADHIAGLTRSLAECPFKRRLTPLSLSANGDHVVQNDPNKELIKKNVWLKALVAIPKVSGSCAIAIAKKYPTMQALFKTYLDPLKTVHEKEFLLQDLTKEGLIGGDGGRRVGPVCSRSVYRILMAQNGNLKTDDVAEGADLFKD